MNNRIAKYTLIIAISFLILILLLGISLFLVSNSFQNKNLEPLGRYLKYKQSTVHIQERGIKQKTAYFFIHGTGSWSSLWLPLMDELEKKGHYSVSVDLEPFGLTFSKDSNNPEVFQRQYQSDMIIDLINQLNIEKVILVGHSFGGRVTLTTASLLKSKLEKIYLINVALGFGSSPENKALPPSSLTSFVINNDIFRNLIAAIGTLPIFTKDLVANFVADENSITPTIEQMYQTPLTMPGKNKQISNWIKEFVLSEDNTILENKNLLSKINVPVVIIWGDLDKVTPPWQAKEINKMFNNSKLEIISGVGHIPMIENFTEFSKIFLKH